MAETSTNYGPPIYMTVNASNNSELIKQAIETAIEEASEYGSVLYLTINSGTPNDPPPTPPGGGGTN